MKEKLSDSRAHPAAQRDHTEWESRGQLPSPFLREPQPWTEVQEAGYLQLGPVIVLV